MQVEWRVEGEEVIYLIHLELKGVRNIMLQPRRDKEVLRKNNCVIFVNNLVILLRIVNLELIDRQDKLII